MLDVIEKINEKYLIKEKLGSGGQANVFLVLDKDTNEEYAAKVLKKESNALDIEINILNTFKQYNNPYIINIIENGEGVIIRKNREAMIRKYCILENALYGNIFDYIYIKNGGFGELKGKIIFLKIAEAIQFCHKHNICHRDLKLENILLDKNFCPKVSDFGLSCENAPNLVQNYGTEVYKPPEVGKSPYDGFKVDIFCLGTILIILVLGIKGFGKPNSKDTYYSKIYNKQFHLYWKLIDPFAKSKGVTLSEEFKKLYIKMVNYKACNRPNIDEILNDPWLKEIKDMIINNKEKYDLLETEIREEFIKLTPSLKEVCHKILEKKDKESEVASYNTKSYNIDNEEKFFTEDCKPKYEDTHMNINYCIKIKGYLNPVKFMNSLCNILIYKYGIDNCYIEANKTKLKFNILFEEEKEEKKEEEKKEEEKEGKKEEGKDLEDEIEKLKIDNNGDEEFNGLSLQVKLIKTSDEYIIQFVHKEGNRKDFLDKYVEISKLVENLMN